LAIPCRSRKYALLHDDEDVVVVVVTRRRTTNDDALHKYRLTSAGIGLTKVSPPVDRLFRPSPEIRRSSPYTDPRQTVYNMFFPSAFRRYSSQARIQAFGEK